MMMRLKAVFIWAGILVVATIIGGCYETEFPLLETGERAALAGKYECTNRIDGSKKMHTTVEEKEGLVFTTYRYKDSDGDTILAKKLQSGLFLAQSPLKEGGFGYAYIDFLDDKTYLVLIADLLSKSDYIEVLSKKYKVDGEKKDTSVSLKGDKKAILDFLAAHDKGLLMVVLKCEKQFEPSQSRPAAPTTSHSPAPSPQAPQATAYSPPISQAQNLDEADKPLSLTGHTGAVYDVAFSPDGNRIVSAGSSDRTLKMWDAATGQETLTLTGHTGFVISGAFSPDGKWIASGSGNYTLMV